MPWRWTRGQRAGFRQPAQIIGWREAGEDRERRGDRHAGKESAVAIALFKNCACAHTPATRETQLYAHRLTACFQRSELLIDNVAV
jgi:hypothetical protein